MKKFRNSSPIEFRNRVFYDVDLTHVNYYKIS